MPRFRNTHRSILLATAVAMLALLVPAAAPARPEPPSAAAFERATRALLRSGTLTVPAVARGGGIGNSGSHRDEVFPDSRLLNLYGAPQLTATVLGQLDPEAAARKAMRQARPYARIGDRPVIPGLDLIAVVANSTPGRDRLYRTRQPGRLIRAYLRVARSVGGRLMLDIQPGRARVGAEVRALERWIAKPEVDVAIDPEWAVGRRGIPGQTAGGIGARRINRVSGRIQAIVDEHDLPPKALVVHQFHRGSVRGRRQIRQRREVAVALNFDGIGSPAAKRAGYAALAAPSAFNGFSVFYSLDTRIMSPRSILGLGPAVDFLLYQ
ncbi:MAG: hypothetical protein EDQ89_01970 [Acidobacteria bacterium]|nr:MAG: hypothetical protein EDQ89_01970 [Acidobacteriota bacterium]